MKFLQKFLQWFSAQWAELELDAEAVFQKVQAQTA
jgi:hypothetical protein